MKYVALLRGINVGGKSTLRMTELKILLEKTGLADVQTYINSGNVIFTSEKSNTQLESELQKLLEKTFFPITTIVLSQTQLATVLTKAPANWNHGDLRRYVAFLKSPTTPEQVVHAAKPKEGIDSIEKGPGVVYMTTSLAGITKSGFPKLSSTPLYQQITIRNFTTVQKLYALMN